MCEFIRFRIQDSRTVLVEIKNFIKRVPYKDERKLFRTEKGRKDLNFSLIFVEKTNILW